MIITCLILAFIIYAKKHRLFNFRTMKKSDDSKMEIMLNGRNIMLNIFLLALPIMFSNLLKSIHDVVDLYYVGEVVLPGVAPEIAEKSLVAMFSAINVTTPIINVCQALAMGFMVAGLALMSQYLGAKKDDKARAVSAHLLAFCFIVGIVTNILLFIFASNILASIETNFLSRIPILYHLLRVSQAFLNSASIIEEISSKA